MSKIFFFIQEGLRAMRRSAAPSIAAVVTIVVTVVLIGVLIPVVQTTQAKSNEVRDQLELKTFLFDDATPQETDQLSGGEQQRVSVARAFVNHPPLLIADEPTGNLDPETSIGIMQLLYRINQTGTTVVVVTHDHQMVDKMRRRVIELYEGRIVRDETSGGYGSEESTNEFAMRMRAEMGVGPEGATNGEVDELI